MPDHPATRAPTAPSTRLPSLGPRGEGWVVIQFVLGGAIVVAGLVAGGAWTGLAAVVTAVLGVVLLVLGGGLAGRGILDLGRDLTPFPRPGDGAEFVQHGAFRHARHPIYGGIAIAGIGWAALTASPLALVLAVALLAFFDAKSRREEAWLASRFPDYPSYQARTRRLIPGIY
jgi:protein-S-isoprenylcysteine O-methyltransferase Ste14